MIPYRGIVAALGIATHDNVPKVVIISQGDSGKGPRDIHPWEASRDVIEKAKLIPFDQSRLEIKETARLNGDFELYELRKFFATWSQGVSESIPCRALPSEFMVLVERYWSPRLGIGTSHRGFVAEFEWFW